jgi:hypothetical protein
MDNITDGSEKNNYYSVNPLFELLRADGSITVNKALTHAIGLNEAILYCELVSRLIYFNDRGRLTKDGYFFNTINDLQAGTSLTEYQQRRALNRLEKLGLISTRLQGMPAKRHFRINLDMSLLGLCLREGKDIMKKYKEYKAAESLINQQIGSNFRTRTEETSELDQQKLRTNNTKVNNIKNEEEEEPAASLINSEEINILDIYLNGYIDKTGSEVIKISKQNINALTKLVTLCGEAEAGELLKIWFDKADQGTANNGWPVGFLLNQLSEYQAKLKEYRKEEQQRAAQAERQRLQDEEERQEEEARRKEEQRRASLTDAERRLEDIASRRLRVSMLLDLRIKSEDQGQETKEKVKAYQAELAELAAEEARLLPQIKEA